jgi:glycosyltransferase involved in cell wall biosynthesis
MSLSVILPNYNHAALIPRALRALVAQEPAADEIIVVDDGSTDDSVAVIESFQRLHKSIRLIRQEQNRGITASVKTALDVVNGEFLYLAASDDFVLPGLFSRALSALRENPQAAFFCSGVAMLDPQDRLIGIRPFAFPRFSSGYISPADVRQGIRDTDFWFMGPSLVYRRQRLADIGYFDESLGTICDTLAYRLLAFRFGFCFDPEILAAYRKYADSVSGRNALSVTETNRMLNNAEVWMARTLPADIRDEHSRLFDRRMRFGMARLWVIWRKGRLDSEAVTEILKLQPFDRAVIGFASRVPFISSFLVLAWMAARTRPFGSLALFKAWLYQATVNRKRRNRIERLVADAATPSPH